jgi:hypothetical protein
MTLKRELGTFSVKTTDSANETFESWREHDHDVLVLAIALATFAAEKWWLTKPLPQPRA